MTTVSGDNFIRQCRVLVEVADKQEALIDDILAAIIAARDQADPGVFAPESMARWIEKRAEIKGLME